MGIYIKDIEMPKNHDHVTITIWSNGAASYGLYNRGESLVGFRNVEVISVPPHGDLIERDYLKQTHCAECTLYPDNCLEKSGEECDWGSIAHLYMCPVVIPADKERI